MKLLFYDLETTGLLPNKHSIHQLAAMYFENGELVKEIEIKFKPNPKALIDQEALDLKNITMDNLMNRQSYNEGFYEFKNYISAWCNKFDKNDKIELIGYNNRTFDDQFLRGFFLQNDDKYYGSFFHQQSRDVNVLAVECLSPYRGELANFKLMEVARYLGIEVDESKAHDALYDVRATFAVWLELRNRFFVKF
jgi:DNA polymerase III subunit epsilon